MKVSVIKYFGTAKHPLLPLSDSLTKASKNEGLVNLNHFHDPDNQNSTKVKFSFKILGHVNSFKDQHNRMQQFTCDSALTTCNTAVGSLCLKVPDSSVSSKCLVSQWQHWWQAQPRLCKTQSTWLGLVILLLCSQKQQQRWIWRWHCGRCFEHLDQSYAYQQDYVMCQTSPATWGQKAARHAAKGMPLRRSNWKLDGAKLQPRLCPRTYDGWMMATARPGTTS